MIQLSDKAQDLLIAVIFIVAVGTGLSFFLAGQYGSIPCGGPCPGREAMNLETRTTNTPTNMTLNLLNTGTVWISIERYSVRPASSQTFSNGTVSGLSFAPNTLVALNIVIGAGTFTFQ